MPDTKLKLKDPGTIHLMALDTASLFLPFGRPIADYLRGAVANQNGARALLNQGAIDFSPVVRWTESMAALLRTTGFGELEREGLIVPDAPPPPEQSDPGVAGFLSFDEPGFATREADQTKISPSVAGDAAISLPRVSALPLRPRMTFGPAPASKIKPAPVAAPKQVAPPVAKAGPVVVPKATPPAPPKPVAAPVPPPKAAAPSVVQPKPVTSIPPAPAAAPVSKPIVAPAAKVLPPVAPTVRALEVTPVQPKASPIPVRTPVAPAARAVETIVSPVEASVAVKPAPVAPKAPAPIAASKPAAAAVSAPPPPAPSPVTRAAVRTPWAEPAEQPVREVAPRETPREREPETRPKGSGNLSLFAPSVPSESTQHSPDGPNLRMEDTETGGFLQKIPMAARLGAGLLLALVILYFLFGRGSGDKTNAPQAAVSVGEQGWSTEWASDTGGSKRGRQITLYRPSTGMTDYQFQFVGQIESKALGWVFRAADTKNYYAMKIETLRPGAMAISHFAVVEGRESSYSQKPLGIDARAGASYRVKVDIAGPRFTIYVQGEPVDFWTDNRIKAGAVGFMNERDERGASSSVQFAFPKRGN